MTDKLSDNSKLSEKKSDKPKMSEILSDNVEMPLKIRRMTPKSNSSVTLKI
jgi:hypothetical protein